MDGLGENVSGYLCNHGSPGGERGTASSRHCAMLWTQASDEEASSDIIGCHQLTSCVFVCMLQTTQRIFSVWPVAQPVVGEMEMHSVAHYILDHNN